MKQLSILILVVLAASGAVADQAPSISSEDLSRNPILFTSPSGQFQVTFPPGCAKIRTRANEPDLFAGESFDEVTLVEFATCDRFQEEGEGCSVTGIFNYHDQDGKPAGPDQVVKRVEELLGKFSAKIIDQKPVGRDFGEGYEVEGVRVVAAGKEGEGEVLIMGLLSDGDIYLLSAWNVEGDLMKDPDIKTFFDSFRPYVE